MLRNVKNRVLGSLHDEDFALLEPHLKEFTLRQMDILQEAGERIEFVYFPLTGAISLLTVMGDGEAIETATIGNEGMMGAMAAGQATAFSRALVQAPGNALQISCAQFQKALKDSPRLHDTVLRYKDALMAQAQQTAACNALHSLEQRLCRWLLQMHDRCDTDVIPLTQEFLGEMLGVRRTTVTQVANQMQKAGLIRYRRGRIEIADRKGMEKASCECFSVLAHRSDQVFPRAKHK